MSVFPHISMETPGPMARGQLDLPPALVDNVFPQSGHCGTGRPEKRMGVGGWGCLYLFEVPLTKPDHPANNNNKKKVKLSSLIS